MRLPRLPRLLRGVWLLRTLARDLHALRVTQEQQTALLARLVDAYYPTPQALAFADDAPLDPRSPLDGVAAVRDTGVSFLDPLEASLVEAYIARTTADLGRAPTEDEVLTYLADEKTHDLHQRLKARAQELATRPSERR